MNTGIIMKDQKITPGTVIFSEKPFVYCLSSKVRTENCDFCFKRGMLLKCSACQYVFYCGRHCQKEGWTIHKSECKNLKKITPRIIPDAARLLSRLIIILNKNGNQIKSYYTERNFRMYRDLMSHYPNLKNDTKRMEHFESICGVLEEYMQDEILPNSVELMGMFGRLCINSFSICNEEQQTLGTGMYLGASVIDHSCEPNAVALFDGTTLSIRSLVHMPYLDWSKIHISYIDIMNTGEYRRNELERLYYFTCDCSKCLLPTPVEMTSAACPNRNCNNPININNEKCSKCNENIRGDFKKKYTDVNELIDLHLPNMKELAYFDACMICIEKQEGVLHEFNLKRVKILDLGFESSIDLGKFEDARRIGVKLVEPFTKYYGKYHPLTGLLHLKLGKIFNYFNDFRESLDNLKVAYDILKITHGQQSEIFCNELMPLVKDCRSNV